MNEQTFVISRSFSTRTEKADRVLEVAEAFGLGLDDTQFVLYDNLSITIKPGDVIYVTGQSGSGKSVLLRDLTEKMRTEAEWDVADIADMPMLETALINQIGKSTEEGVRLLNYAGLGDAYLYCRRPSELSDGQRYRFRLAKLIELGARVWVADEFAAVLDRQTAKIVAHNVSKIARQLGVTLVVATTHTDLTEYLGPTLVVEKLYGERVELTTHKWVAAND